MVRMVAVVASTALLFASCSPEPTEPADEPQTQPDPTSNIVVSDAVPTLQELQDMGIGERSAQCFIDTIDPDGTGRVTDADLFIEAFSACL